MYVNPRMILAALALAVSPVFAGADSPCGFPARAAKTAWSSAEFYRLHSLPGPLREMAIVAEVLKGNIPDRLRLFQRVSFPGTWQGAAARFEIDVAPDYLAIGTDRDFVRVPLTNYAAQYLAGRLGLVMPTKFLVDLIYDQAAVQLVPQPTDWYKTAGKMRFGPNYVLFNEMIESQRLGREGLVAGHKKDVVATNLLDRAPGSVAIYGWQRPGNRPIQPLATPHSLDYEDYSHGIRLLGPDLKIHTGARTVVMPLAQALTDPELGAVLNGGGRALGDARAARACSPEFAREAGLAPEACPPQPRSCGIGLGSSSVSQEDL